MGCTMGTALIRVKVRFLRGVRWEQHLYGLALGSGYHRHSTGMEGIIDTALGWRVPYTQHCNVVYQGHSTGTKDTMDTAMERRVPWTQHLGISVKQPPLAMVFTVRNIVPTRPYRPAPVQIFNPTPNTVTRAETFWAWL